MRKAAVLAVLREAGVAPAELDAVAARGGVLAGCPAGIYRIGARMARDARSNRYGAHATNLGVLLARDIARRAGIPAFTVNPPTVDEMRPEARYSGIPQIVRRAGWHALNQKAVAARVAARLKKPYRKTNMVIAHLGGGISVAAHRRGRAIDVNGALDGDGPFGIERSGGLPAGDLVRLARRLPLEKVLRLITGEGGVVAYLGTNDMREVERRVRAGDAAAREVIAAMAWQVAREIGACAAVLCGRVDAVVLTGSLARWKYLAGRIRRRVRFIAPVHVVPGEMELEALARGALQALTGRARARDYRPGAGK
jgi:butyrate kinase